MYYDFISLNDVSPTLREAVEDMQMILKKEWNYEENLENERMLKILKNSDSLLAEIMCLKERDSKVVLLLQMAVYRFCKIHFANILKIKSVGDFGLGKVPIIDEDGDYYEFSVSDEIIEGFKEWERGFWLTKDVDMVFIFGSIVSKTISENRRFYREAKPRKKEDNRYFYIEETIKKALEDKETIREVEELRAKYVSLMTKTEKINATVKCKEKDRRLEVVQDMKKIVEIMERNMRGELTPGDIVVLEKYMPGWERNIQRIEELFSEI